MTELSIFVVALSFVTFGLAYRIYMKSSQVYQYLTEMFLPMVENQKTSLYTTEDETNDIFYNINIFSMRTLSVFGAIILAFVLNAIVIATGWTDVGLTFFLVIANAWVIANFGLPKKIWNYVRTIETELTTRVLIKKAAQHAGKQEASIADIVAYVQYENEQIQKEMDESFAELNRVLEESDAEFGEKDDEPSEK